MQSAKLSSYVTNILDSVVGVIRRKLTYHIVTSVDKHVMDNINIV